MKVIVGIRGSFDTGPGVGELLICKPGWTARGAGADHGLFAKRGALNAEALIGGIG